MQGPTQKRSWTLLTPCSCRPPSTPLPSPDRAVGVEGEDALCAVWQACGVDAADAGVAAQLLRHLAVCGGRRGGQMGSRRRGGTSSCCCLHQGTQVQRKATAGPRQCTRPKKRVCRILSSSRLNSAPKPLSPCCTPFIRAPFPPPPRSCAPGFAPDF